MLSLSQASWGRALVFFSVATLLLWHIHAADDLIQGDDDIPLEVFVLISVVFGTVYVFGIMWSWAGKWYGYASVAVVSLFIFFGGYLVHALALGDARSFPDMAQATPELWAPTFVATSLLGGITSLTAIIIAAYLLLRARRGEGA